MQRGSFISTVQLLLDGQDSEAKRFIKQQAHVAQEAVVGAGASCKYILYMEQLCIVAAYLPFTIYHFEAFSLPANVINRFLAM